jgi:hypothetical protein
MRCAALHFLCIVSLMAIVEHTSRNVLYAEMIYALSPRSRRLATISIAASVSPISSPLVSATNPSFLCDAAGSTSPWMARTACMAG